MTTNLLVTAGAVAATGVAINWTAVIAVVTICVAAMGTLIKIYGPKAKISDESLRSSPYLKDLESNVKAKEDKLNALKDLISSLNNEVDKLKIETNHSSKGLEDLRQDNRDLVQRLDRLLNQFMEYMEG